MIILVAVHLRKSCISMDHFIILSSTPGLPIDMFPELHKQYQIVIYFMHATCPTSDIFNSTNLAILCKMFKLRRSLCNIIPSRFT
jgi:hypothetical protein